MNEIWKTLVEILKDIFQNGRSFGRLIILIFFIFLMVMISALCVNNFFGGSISIGGIVIKTGSTIINSSQTIAVYNLPASSCWYETGLIVKPHEQLTITADGSIHTAIDKIANAARTDQVPPFPWNGPEGRTFVTKEYYRDPLRQKFLILQSDEGTIGNLIACLATPQNKPSKFNPHPQGCKIENIGKFGKITNNSDEECILFISVNDIVFDCNNEELSKMAYIGDLKRMPRSKITRDMKANYKQHLSNWPDIVVQKYWDIFFQDNMGTFLVTVQKTKN